MKPSVTSSPRSGWAASPFRSSSHSELVYFGGTGDLAESTVAYAMQGWLWPSRVWSSRVARYAADVAHPSDLEARVAALEARLEEVASDAAAARHLAAARDRDLADLGVKVDANRKAINALGQQTVARFDRFEQRMDSLEQKVDNGFTEMRGKFDQAAAGQQQIVELLNAFIAGQGDQ